MKAIHLICRRNEIGELNNFSFDEKTGRYRSGNWDMRLEDARLLVGGWIYLHEAKLSLSAFGGMIEDIEPIIDVSLKRPNRVVFLIRQKLSGVGQRWRGKVHKMAHSSGLIFADLPHELINIEDISIFLNKI